MPRHVRHRVDLRCVTRGLRKAAARLLAKAGCTANEIAAITGHRTLVEVSRYTKAADQVHLAQTAIDRLTARQSAQRVPTPVKRVGKNPEKPNEINVDLFNWRSLRESNPSFKNENLAS